MPRNYRPLEFIYLPESIAALNDYPSEAAASLTFEDSSTLEPTIREGEDQLNQFQANQQTADGRNPSHQLVSQFFHGSSLSPTVTTNGQQDTTVPGRAYTNATYHTHGDTQNTTIFYSSVCLTSSFETDISALYESLSTLLGSKKNAPAILFLSETMQEAQRVPSAKNQLESTLRTYQTLLNHPSTFSSFMMGTAHSATDSTATSSEDGAAESKQESSAADQPSTLATPQHPTFSSHPIAQVIKTNSLTRVLNPRPVNEYGQLLDIELDKLRKLLDTPSSSDAPLSMENKTSLLLDLQYYLAFFAKYADTAYVSTLFPDDRAKMISEHPAFVATRMDEASPLTQGFVDYLRNNQTGLVEVACDSLGVTRELAQARTNGRAGAYLDFLWNNLDDIQDFIMGNDETFRSFAVDACKFAVQWVKEAKQDLALAKEYDHAIVAEIMLRETQPFFAKQSPLAKHIADLAKFSAHNESADKAAILELARITDELIGHLSSVQTDDSTSELYQDQLQHLEEFCVHATALLKKLALAKKHPLTKLITCLQHINDSIKHVIENGLSHDSHENFANLFYLNFNLLCRDIEKHQNHLAALNRDKLLRTVLEAQKRDSHPLCDEDTTQMDQLIQHLDNPSQPSAFRTTDEIEPSNALIAKLYTGVTCYYQEYNHRHTNDDPSIDEPLQDDFEDDISETISSTKTLLIECYVKNAKKRPEFESLLAINTPEFMAAMEDFLGTLHQMISQMPSHRLATYKTCLQHMMAHFEEKFHESGSSAQAAFSEATRVWFIQCSAYQYFISIQDEDIPETSETILLSAQTTYLVRQLEDELKDEVGDSFLHQLLHALRSASHVTHSALLSALTKCHHMRSELPDANALLTHASQPLAPALEPAQLVDTQQAQYELRTPYVISLLVSLHASLTMDAACKQRIAEDHTPSILRAHTSISYLADMLQCESRWPQISMWQLFIDSTILLQWLAPSAPSIGADFGSVIDHAAKLTDEQMGSSTWLEDSAETTSTYQTLLEQLKTQAPTTELTQSVYRFTMAMLNNVKGPLEEGAAYLTAPMMLVARQWLLTLARIDVNLSAGNRYAPCSVLLAEVELTVQPNNLPVVTELMHNHNTTFSIMGTHAQRTLSLAIQHAASHLYALLHTVFDHSNTDNADHNTPELLQTLGGIVPTPTSTPHPSVEAPELYNNVLDALSSLTEEAAHVDRIITLCSALDALADTIPALETTASTARTATNHYLQHLLLQAHNWMENRYFKNAELPSVNRLSLNSLNRLDSTPFSDMVTTALQEPAAISDITHRYGQLTTDTLCNNTLEYTYRLSLTDGECYAQLERAAINDVDLTSHCTADTFTRDICSTHKTKHFYYLLAQYRFSKTFEILNKLALRVDVSPELIHKFRNELFDPLSFSSQANGSAYKSFTEKHFRQLCTLSDEDVEKLNNAIIRLWNLPTDDPYTAPLEFHQKSLNQLLREHYFPRICAALREINDPAAEDMLNQKIAELIDRHAITFLLSNTANDIDDTTNSLMQSTPSADAIETHFDSIISELDRNTPAEDPTFFVRINLSIHPQRRTVHALHRLPSTVDTHAQIRVKERAWQALLNVEQGSHGAEACDTVLLLKLLYIYQYFPEENVARQLKEKLSQKLGCKLGALHYKKLFKLLALTQSELFIQSIARHITRPGAINIEWTSFRGALVEVKLPANSSCMRTLEELAETHARLIREDLPDDTLLIVCLRDAGKQGEISRLFFSTNRPYAGRPSVPTHQSCLNILSMFTSQQPSLSTRTLMPGHVIVRQDPYTEHLTAIFTKLVAVKDFQGIVVTAYRLYTLFLERDQADLAHHVRSLLQNPSNLQDTSLQGHPNAPIRHPLTESWIELAFSLLSSKPRIQPRQCVNVGKLCCFAYFGGPDSHEQLNLLAVLHNNFYENQLFEKCLAIQIYLQSIDWSVEANLEDGHEAWNNRLQHYHQCCYNGDGSFKHKDKGLTEDQRIDYLETYLEGMKENIQHEEEAVLASVTAAPSTPSPNRV